MKIPILPALESQQQWLSFSAQQIPYAYVNSPLTLVDFQSTFIQITDISKNLRDGRQAQKFSVGARRSSSAAWQLIESSQWSLKRLMAGLNDLEFTSNVRDNSAINAHGELTLRQFYAKDKCVISPLLLQPLTPLKTMPKAWFLQDIKRVLSCEQYSDVKWLSQDPMLNSCAAVLMQLISHPQGWRIDRQHELLVLSLKKVFIMHFRPVIDPPLNTLITLQKL
ncbi:MAG: hypothetical protein V7784_18180 [Oceanospirillaceae bacterium]